MPNFLIYPTDTSCINAESYLGEICFTREDCTPTCTELYLSECGQTWNCTLGQCDKEFHNPYIAGDVIQFQTKFVDDFNTDETNPTQGWGDFVTAEVCDETGAVIATHLDASRAIVGWDGSSSYQILEIDTSAFTSCFSVTIQSFNQAGAAEQLCSESFKPVECDEPTIVIESTFNCYDCCGQYYGEPQAFIGDNFNYSNRWRYYGEVIDAGLSFTKDVVGEKRRKTEFSDVFQIGNTGRLVPPYIKSMLYKVHLGAERFTIDGVEYLLDQANVAPAEDSRMFFINPQITRECDIDHACDC